MAYGRVTVKDEQGIVYDCCTFKGEQSYHTTLSLGTTDVVPATTADERRQVFVANPQRWRPVSKECKYFDLRQPLHPRAVRWRRPTRSVYLPHELCAAVQV